VDPLLVWSLPRFGRELISSVSAQWIVGQNKLSSKYLSGPGRICPNDVQRGLLQEIAKVKPVTEMHEPYHSSQFRPQPSWGALSPTILNCPEVTFAACFCCGAVLFPLGRPVPSPLPGLSIWEATEPSSQLPHHCLSALLKRVCQRLLWSPGLHKPGRTKGSISLVWVLFP
jgi:hypothetical protein